MLKNFNRLKALIKKEFLAILRDPKSRIIIIFPPLVQLLIFANALTMEIKNADILVMDRSNTYESREFIAGIENSKWFGNVTRAESLREIEQKIDRQQADAAILIAPDFARNLKKGQTADVSAVLDGRVSGTATALSGYFTQIAQNYTLKLAEKSGKTAVPPSIETRVWFNPNAVYQWYLVISLNVIMALVVTLILTALSVARERELGTFEQLIVSPYTALEILTGKTVPPLTVALIMLSVMALISVYCFDIPFTGSFLLYLGSSFIALLSFVGVGLFISAVSKNQQQAILGAFAFMMPAILLSGFVSPIEDMPPFLQNLTCLNPVRFFINIGRGLFLKNMPAADVAANLLPLIVIGGLTLSFAAMTFKRNLE